MRRAPTCAGLPRETGDLAPGDALVVCHLPRMMGSAPALALAERVAGLFREGAGGTLRFGSPSIEFDGRDPGGFRLVIALPVRRGDAG